MPSWAFIRLLLGLVLLLAGCRNQADRAAEALARVGTPKLRTEAARVYKDAFAGHGADFVLISRTNWPKSFQQLTPVQVSAYPDGIAITLQSEGREESGFYVVPEHMDIQPASHSNFLLRKLDEGIFWYELQRW